jgi:LacI family transcriptional regulator
MANKRTTIHDIAKALDLTASTVSRALNDHPKISSETKELVRKKAKELNYTTNTLAASLRTGKAKTLGLIVPRINRFFISNTISGIESVTNKAGYNIIICQSEESLQKEEQNIITLINSRVDGIMIAISFETNTSKHIEKARKSGIPIVQFDRIRDDIQVSNVLNDNEMASYTAVKHLIDQGYTSIAHFSGPLHINIYQQRLAGYKKALLESNIPFNESLVFENVLDKEKGFQTTLSIYKNKLNVDAIFSASDYSALGALLAAKQLQLSIPQQIGIVGFADEPFTEFVSPSLTSVNQFAEEMGATVAKTMIDQIESHRDELVPKSISITPRLIVRESSMRISKTIES